MKLAAIIAEYNPFHNGHKYQIDEARKLLGEDTAIIAIMSGNYTQRGEIAIADKTVRAKLAVLEGVNLVLELPFPSSSNTAEIFAKSGVHIADSIGADYLIFGSECGDIGTISKAAEIMMSDKFSDLYECLKNDKSNKSKSYPQIVEEAYMALGGDKLDFDISSPNNILAIEYMKAIREFGCGITPLTIKREGAGYSDTDIAENTKLQSATAIRELLCKEDSSAYEYMPKNAKNVFDEAKSSGLMPANIEKISPAIISFLRLNTQSDIDIFDADGGLYNRLCTLSMKTNSILSLAASAETKTHTKARIRRALINSFFGVTSSIAKELPAYTQVLAFDEIGRRALKRIKKTTDFPCITKPADYGAFSDAVTRQKELSNKADSVYVLSLPGDIPGAFHLTFTPFVKK